MVATRAIPKATRATTLAKAGDFAPAAMGPVSRARGPVVSQDLPF